MKKGLIQYMVSRRKFLKEITLGGVVLMAFLASCLERNKKTAESSSPSPQPRKDTVSKIALVRTRNRKEGVPRAIKLLGINPVKGKAVTLKPNFNTADPFPASTHNDTLRALILTLKEMGASRILLAERSGPADTREVMVKKGIFGMGEELGFDILNLDELGNEGWVRLEPETSHWRRGFLFARIYYEAECILQTCCLKTHMYGGHFTMSLKNSVGMVSRSNMGELHASPHQRKLIAEINTAYSPDLILLDGMEAFVTGGPMEGTRKEVGVILAGSDRVALDAVGVAILRLLGTTPQVMQGHVFAQEQIARAAELGLGVSFPDQIEFVTDDRESEAFAQKLIDILRDKGT